VSETVTQKWTSWLLFGAAAALLVLSFTGLKGRGLPRGKEAPDIALPLIAGAPTKLSEGYGRPQVLAFWATWCGPCREELPELDRVYKKYEKDVRFFAVNVEDLTMRPMVEAFVQKTGLQMPVVFDGGAAASRYHASSIPMLVILDKTGKISETFTGQQPESRVTGAIDRALATN